MKKFLSVLLAALFLLTACTGEGDTSVADTSDASDVSDSGTVREEYTLDSAKVQQMVADRTEAIKGDADRTGKRVDEAIGKKYTITEGNENKFEDKENYLTDGSFNETHFKFVKTGWVGVIKNGTEITVDLGEVVEGLSDFELSSCRNTEYDVDMCTAMFVHISEDGESWKNVGIYYTTGMEADKARHMLCVNLNGTVNARYVKFTVEGLLDEFMVIDEISAYTYSGEIVGQQNSLNDFYGVNEIPVITEDKYYDEGTEGYNDRKNLLQSLVPVSYTSVTDVQETMLVTSYNSNNFKLLTDGKHAKATNMSDSAWFRNTHGTSRSAVYDMGGIVSVDEGYAYFLQSTAPGIRIPQNFAVSVSLDGEKWHVVYQTAATTETDNVSVTFGGKFDKAYKARYVKIDFSCTVHTYVDEIEIFGTLNASAAADPSTTPLKDAVLSSSYGKPEDYDGMHDIVLSYLCPPMGDNGISVTKEQYLAYVAYLEDGEIKDTFYDGFMYLPYVKYLYSGGEKKQLTKEEWQAWIDYQYMEGYNFDALDAATDEVKAALNLGDDYTVGTYLSLFYPVYNATNFGELNGKQLDFSNIEDRKAVLKWFIDEQIAGFKAKGYDSVRLSGFYWFVEEMSTSDPHIRELVNYCCDYIRSLGYQTTWIPYFSASGNTAWREYGFDTACLQPNYAFNEDVPLQRIYDAAALAKLYGMSIEIEIEGMSGVNWVNRYRQYLYVGAEVGFMTDSVHMYYLAGMPGAIYQAYVSNNPEYNCIYKETYLFIKGQLSSKFDAPTVEDVSTEAGKPVTGTVTPALGTVQCEGVKLLISAEHGSVTVNADGTFCYIPFEGFTGEDSFTVVADYGLAGISDAGEIKVTVK